MTTKEEDQTGLAGLESQFAQMTTDTQRTVPQLKQFCRDNKIKGFSALNKEGLQKLIEDHGTTLQKAEMDAVFEEMMKKVEKKENPEDEVVTELASLFKTWNVSKSMIETEELKEINKLKETEELEKAEKYAIILKEFINWKSLARLIKYTANDLNDRVLRFDKGVICEKALCKYFYEEKGQRFIWKDEEGYDILDQETNTKIEVKYVIDGLIQRARGKEKSVTGNYRLKNTMGKSKESETIAPYIKRPADFYILLSKYKFVVTTYELMLPHLKYTGDCTILDKMPLTKSVLLSKFKEDEIIYDESDKERYMDLKNTIMDFYINQFK